MWYDERDSMITERNSRGWLHLSAFGRLSGLVWLLIILAGAGLNRQDMALAQGEMTEFELAGHIGGSVGEVVIHGDHLLVGVGPKLAILDAQNPDLSNPIGITDPMDGIVTTISPMGEYVIVLLRGRGVRTIDISDPADPRPIAALDLPGYSFEMAVLDSMVYVAAGSDGLRILDASDASLVEVNALELNESMHIAAVGGRLIASSGTSLLIYSLESPGGRFDPVLLSQVEGVTGRGARIALSADGELAFVGNDETMRILELSDSGQAPGVRELSSIIVGNHGDIKVLEEKVLLATNGISIIDVSDPSNPTIASKTNTGGYGKIDANTERIYASASTVIDVYEIDESINPFQSFELTTVGEVADIVIQGSYAYLAVRKYGLRVLDVSQIGAPVLLAEIPMSADPIQLEVSGDYLYAIIYHRGLQVFDLSRPDLPVERAFIETPGMPKDMAIAGEYAYIAESRNAPENQISGMSVLSLSDPSQPKILSRVNMEDILSASAIAFDNDNVYLLVNSVELWIYDVRDRRHPIHVGTYLAFTSSTVSTSVEVSGGYVYIAGGSLEIVDATDPSKPRLHSALYYGWTKETFIDGSELYLASNERGVVVFDISRPSMPIEIKRLDIPGIYDAVAKSGGHIIVAERNVGLRFIDQSQSAAFKLVGRTITEGPASQLDFDEDRLAILSGTWLRTLEVGPDGMFGRATHAIVDVGRISPIFDLAGPYIYVLERTTLSIMDVQDPSRPQLRSTLRVTANVFDGKIHVEGDYAYLSFGGDDAGLYIVDVSDPRQPAVVGSFKTPGEQPTDLFAAEGFVYLVDGTVGDPNGLRIIDVSDPTQPKSIAQLSTGGPASGITVKGNLAYIADWEGVLRIVNVFDPERPVELGQYATPGQYMFTVAVDDEYAYVSLDTGGMETVDIRDPRSPKGVDRISMAEPVMMTATGQGFVFASTVRAGLYVFREKGAVAPTSTASPTVAVTTTPSSQPTRTATQVPAPDKKLYLPYLAVAGAIDGSGEDHAHFSVLFDVSSSMARPLNADEDLTRLDAAREFGLGLLRRRDFADHSAGVIRFDRQAELLSSGHGRPELERAIERLEIGSAENRIDLALAAADEDLRQTFGNHISTDCGLVVLITDEAEEISHGSEAVDRARDLRALGTQIHVLVLSEDADAAILDEIAGSRDRIYTASALDDPSALHARLADDIKGCGQ